MTDDQIRKLVGEAVRFAVFAASLDEEFGSGVIALDVADPTITVEDARDWRRVAQLVAVRTHSEHVEVSDNLDEEGGDILPGSEITLRWTHTTRTGRSYPCTVYVVLDK